MFALSVTLAILMLSLSFGIAVNACRPLRLAPHALPPTPRGKAGKEQLTMGIFGKTLSNTLGHASLVLLLTLLILAGGTREAAAQARSATGFVFPTGSATWNHAAVHGGLTRSFLAERSRRGVINRNLATLINHRITIAHPHPACQHPLKILITCE